ncbi:hypothetical protein [Sanguibacter keddieii]|uniref:hypothetical protein n=1 Tax=Sanguibacter keddieii TaxID=60920 RepID=UPI00066059C9|nr:hypothetical protein [Sanguibacter keddieii]
MSNDFSRWAPPDTDSSPAPGAKPTTQSTAEQPADRVASTGTSPVSDRFAPTIGQSEGTATGQSGVASSLKPVLGSLVTGATRTTAAPRSSASPHEASSPASAPRKGRRPPRRTRDPQHLARNALDKKVIIGAVLAVVVLVLAVPRLMANAPSFSGITRGPIAVQGYQGSATNTNVLSSNWAAGVSPAWVLADPRSDVEQEHRTWTRLFADGTTIYMASLSDTNRSFSIAAIDVSSSTPSVLWTSSDASVRMTHETSNFSIVSAGQWLIVGNILVSKSTGIQAEGPWEDDQPMALVDDVLVTCSGYETCSGWTYSSGSWKRLWQAITGHQSNNSKVRQLEVPPTIGSGEDASVIVPVDDYRNLQIVNAHTGVVTTLGAEGRFKQPSSLTALYPTADGLILDKKANQLEKYDVTGTFISAFDRNTKNKVYTDDGAVPTLSDLEAFFTSGKTPWTTGMMEASGDRCEVLTLHTTAGAATYSAEGMKGIADSYGSFCLFAPTHARASADGAAAFVQRIGYKEQSVYFFDMANNKAYTSTDLTAAQNLTWVYDDLLVGVTDEGLIAFTPTSS